MLTGLVLVVLISLLGSALFDVSRLEGRLWSGDVSTTQALYCAEAAFARTVGDSTRVTALGAVTAGNSTTFGPDTLTTSSGSCSASVVVTYEAGGARYATSTATMSGQQRGVRLNLNFLSPAFEYAVVANGGSLHLRGTGAPNLSGSGGADVVNGDVMVNGNVILGEPGTGQAPAVNPYSVSDTRSTVSTLSGSGYSVMDNSSAFPRSSPNDNNPIGTSSSMPQPDVAGYVSDLKNAVGLTSTNVGAMTGTYKGAPVYNLKAIFDSTVGLGANADGSLRQPSGCGCGAAAAGKCKVYCDLRTMNIMKNPSDRATENATFPGDDYYFDGVMQAGEIFASPKVGAQGATRLVDITVPNSEAPLLLADGNARFHALDALGFGLNGMGTIVTTQDFIMSDNIIYKDGIANTNLDPSKGPTADVLGIVAGRDIWFGDPVYGTFFEGSATMLAGRDFNYMFLKGDGTCCRTPDNAITLNGTMLANRQVAVFRDFANPTNRDDTCGPGSDLCQPVAFDPNDNSCGGGGCWRFMMRDASGNVVVDTSKASFRECTGGGSCGNGRFRVAHYQMTTNYETRVRVNSHLVPPGLPTAPNGTILAGWQDWRECPPCN
jgi:hypothetical protein